MMIGHKGFIGWLSRRTNVALAFLSSFAVATRSIDKIIKYVILFIGLSVYLVLSKIKTFWNWNFLDCYLLDCVEYKFRIWHVKHRENVELHNVIFLAGICTPIILGSCDGQASLSHLKEWIISLGLSKRCRLESVLST